MKLQTCVRSGLAIMVAFLVSESPAQATGNFDLSVGGGVSVAPKYEGSDDYRVIGYPIVFPRFSGNETLDAFGSRLTIRELDDVRFRALSARGFELGPVIGYRFERDEDDGDLLQGLGDVDGGLVLGVYAGYRFGPFLMDLAFRDQVTGDADGYRITAAIGVERQINPRLLLKARIGATYADDDYMQAYFGITADQSASSVAGLPAYTPDAGIKDVHFELGAKFALTPQIDLSPRVRYKRLLGDAEDSPIVESADQFSGSLTLIYKFGRY